MECHNIRLKAEINHIIMILTGETLRSWKFNAGFFKVYYSLKILKPLIKLLLARVIQVLHL